MSETIKITEEKTEPVIKFGSIPRQPFTHKNNDPPPVAQLPARPPMPTIHITAGNHQDHFEISVASHIIDRPPAHTRAKAIVDDTLKTAKETALIAPEFSRLAELQRRHAEAVRRAGEATAALATAEREHTAAVAAAGDTDSAWANVAAAQASITRFQREAAQLSGLVQNAEAAAQAVLEAAITQAYDALRQQAAARREELEAKLVEALPPLVALWCEVGELTRLSHSRQNTNRPFVLPVETMPTPRRVKESQA